MLLLVLSAVQLGDFQGYHRPNGHRVVEEKDFALIPALFPPGDDEHDAITAPEGRSFYSIGHSFESCTTAFLIFEAFGAASLLRDLVNSACSPSPLRSQRA